MKYKGRKLLRLLLMIGVFAITFSFGMKKEAYAFDVQEKSAVELSKALEEKALFVTFKNPSANKNQYYYTGKEIKPEVVVSYKADELLELKQGVDISVQVTAGKAIGTYQVKIDGISAEYKGSIQVPYEIVIKSPTIKLNMTTIKLKKKQSTTLFQVSGLAAGDSIKEYRSSNPKIFTVTQNGKITAKNKKGSATLSVILRSGKIGKATVKVQSGKVKTTSVSVNTTSLKLAVTQQYQLKSSKAPLTSQQKIKYSSSNKKIATVNSQGLVVAKKKGSCKIYVKSGSKKKTVSVSVLANSVPKGDANAFLNTCRVIANQILTDGNWVYSNSNVKNNYKDARAASKRVTNCAHFVSLCVQEFGGLNKGQTFYGKSDGSIHASSSTMSVLKTNYDIINMNKQPFPSVKDKLKPGDICIWVGQHTNIFAGKDAQGKLGWFDAGGDMTADGKHNSGPFSRLYKTSDFKNWKLSYIIRLKQQPQTGSKN